MKILPVNNITPKTYLTIKAEPVNNPIENKKIKSNAPLSAASYGIVFGAKFPQVKTLSLLTAGTTAVALGAAYEALLENLAFDIDSEAVLEVNGEKYSTDYDTICNIKSAATAWDFLTNKALRQRAKSNKEIPATETTPSYKAFYNSKGEVIRKVYDDKTEYIYNMAEKGQREAEPPVHIVEKEKDGTITRISLIMPAKNKGDLEMSDIIEKQQDGEYTLKRYCVKDAPSNGEYFGGYFRKISE